MTITEDVEDWMYNQLEATTHLLHGVVHANGYGHLLRVNGREGGSRVLPGCHIMDFWDRLCKVLAVRLGFSIVISALSVVRLLIKIVQVDNKMHLHLIVLILPILEVYSIIWHASINPTPESPTIKNKNIQSLFFRFIDHCG